MATTSKTHWLSKYLFAILSMLLLGGMVLSWSSTAQARQSEVDEINTKITALQTELAAEQAKASEVRQKVLQDLTGYDMRRQDRDMAAAKDMVATATTWSNGNQYIEAREKVIRVWKLDENSQFMVRFLPGEKQGAFRRDGDGTLHFAYPHVNSSLVSMESTLTEVSGDKWTYFALIETTSKSGAGATAKAWTAMTYTVDGDGAITDVAAYPSKAPPSESD